MENTETTTINEIHLELGDIIMIYAPTNPELHHNAFFIKYIDETKIKLINTADRNIVQLNLDENGQITDESIKQIRLKSRSTEKGFARQFGLLPDKWVNIHFGGEYPRIDVGKITNLEEDMIEVTIVPDNVIYYIDFEYKGIPEYLPIEKIVIRSKPSFLGNKDVDELVENLTDERDKEGEPDAPVIDALAYTEGEQSPVNSEPEEFMPNLLTAMYLDADEIFEENLGEITQMVEVSEREKRHTLEMQVSNIADKLLAKIPVSGRTGEVADRIQNIINKFKQLRENYSILDDNNNVVQPRLPDPFNKPIVGKLKEFKEKLSWIIPVVSNKKIIYGNETEAEQDGAKGATHGYTVVDGDKIIAKDAEIQETFSNKKSGRGESELKYDKMVRELYENGLAHDIPDPIAQRSAHRIVVDDCIEAIIEHLDAFMSYTVGNFTKSRFGGGAGDDGLVDVDTREFITSRFCGSATKIMTETLKSGKKIQEREKITDGDEIFVKSLVVLPEQVMRYSRVHLPATGILAKTELAMTEMHLHRVLRNSKDCENVVVYDLDKHIDFENSEDAPKLLEKIQQFMVGDELSIHSKEDFEQFLNCIFPNIRTIIRLMEKYMGWSFTFIQVLENLEPFAVYADSITFKQYNEIRYFLKEKIKKYKARLGDKTREYVYYKNADLKIEKMVGNIAGMFADKANYSEWMKNAYELNVQEKTGSELVSKMVELDCGKFFSKLIAHRMLELFTPNNIMKVITSAHDGDEDDTSKKLASSKCGPRKTIAKKYPSISALQKDNGKEDIVFDKELDDTPYHLLDLYKAKRAEVEPAKFTDYFEIVLKDKHGCPENMAGDLAKTILAGKKKVGEGDYALVEIRDVPATSIEDEDKTAGDIAGGATKSPVVKTAYFKRVGETWVRDNEIGEEAFIDSNKLLCNLSDANCVSIGKTIEQCANEKEATAYFQNILKNRVLSEFDKKMEMSIDEIKIKLEAELSFLRQQIERQKKLKHAELYKTNNIMYKIGQTEKATEHGDSVVQSQYITLRDTIMSQTDFVKKQQDIVRFCAMYCRNAMLDKDEIDQWFYCKETNTKLFPRSLHKLAEAFLVSGEEYNRVMVQLYKEVGTLSEDKDCIIDKYTNYKLSNIETREEEDFDANGFRIITHGELEGDEVEELASSLLGGTDTASSVSGSSAKKIFDDETTQTLYNICSKLTKDMGVPIENRSAIEERAMALAKPMTISKIPSQAVYDRKREEVEKNTGKKSGMPPYTVFCDKMYIYLGACAVVLAIQTATPSVKITKTYAGCVRILDGFPLGGMENMGTMKYMACILLKVVAKVRPWNALEQIKTVESMTANMMKTMTDIYLKSAEIEEMIARKREYLAVTPDTVVPEIRAVEKWVRFMPPLITYSVEKTLQSVSTTFKKELEGMIKTGHKDQDIYLNILKSKLLAHTYGIVEQVNNVVKTKNMLLTTRSNVPFTENACCNELQTENALAYFKHEDGNIEQFIRRCANMQTILNSVKALSTPSILYHPLATNIRYKKVPAEISEEVVYSAIIHYCKLDRNIPIPPQFHGIMSSKVAGYDRNWTIEEKVGFLKRHGKVFGIDHLNTLMNIVSRQNRVEGITFKETPVLQIHALRDFLKEMDTLDKTAIANNVVDAKLRYLLSNVVDDYKPTIIVNQMRASEVALRKHLMKMNGDMIQGISDFLQENVATMSKREMGALVDYVASVDKWELDAKGAKESEHAIFTIIQYIKSSIYSLTKMYPNKIINNNVATFTALKHWKLSAENKSDLEEMYKATFASFEKYVGHPVAVKMLAKAEPYFANLALFVDTMPTIASIYRDGVEFFALMSKSTLMLLFKYCWLSVWHTYCVAFSDRELRELDREMRRYNGRVDGYLGKKTNVAGVDVEYDLGVDADHELNVSIMRGVQKDASQVMASILSEFMRVELKTKVLYNLSYDVFEKKIYKTREDEKREITEYLGNMDDEERAVENMMKKFKLGRWGVGLDKGLYKYDKEKYDKEREVMKMRLRDELAGNEYSYLFANNLGGVRVEQSYDAYELEKMEMDEQAGQYDIGIDEINIDAEFGGEFDDGDEGFDDYED